MSESHDQMTADRTANPVQSLVVSRLARAVHDGSVPVLFLVSMLAGCVIPPSLSVENQDAGVNSPPAITAVRAEDNELAPADPMKPAIFVPNEGTIAVSLLDTDVLDTLNVRVFVNYTATTPEPARSQCTAAPAGSARRTVTCDVGAVCFEDEPGDFNMTVMVFDRKLLESGEPLHQAMEEGGLSASKFFFLRCEGVGS
jgi:hypothetical protein